MTQFQSARAQARASSWLLFASLAVVSYAALNGVSGLFPGDRTGAIIGRAACSLAIVALLLAGSSALLKRDNLPADRFGLTPTPAHARAFLLGCLGACLVMAVLIGTLYVVLPFEWQRGSRSIHDVGLAGANYLIGNSAEELLFRGYAFIALANVLLHAVSGFGQGTSAFDIVLHRPLPTSFDLPFTVFLFSAAAVALLMSRLPAVRRGAGWLEGAEPR